MSSDVSRYFSSRRRLRSTPIAAVLSVLVVGVQAQNRTLAVEDRYTVTTLAGSSGVGDADGSGGNARFFLPQGAAVGPDGNMYIADTNNNTIRKMTPDGDVTTFAGKAGESGSTDGTGPAARFYRPQHPAIDRSGVLYVADGNNHTIRRITPAGVVTTLAGHAGSPGSTDGPAASARFYYPDGTAVDQFGNVYVADTYNHTIRRIGASGTVTTIAGSPGQPGSDDGAGSQARFNFPQHVAVDSTGTLYVADSSNHTIRKIVGDNVTTLAGSAGESGTANGVGGAARFNTPNGVMVFGNDLYVNDVNNSTIRKIAPDGSVTTFAGGAGIIGSLDGTGTGARFAYPSRGIGFDASGTAYVGDTNNQTIRKITSAGAVSTIAGSPTTGRVDGAGTAARFTQPMGIAVDRSGIVYVADYFNHAIRKIAPNGTVTTLAGTLGTAGNADGNGAAARFRYPRYIAIAPSGTLYVTDGSNHTIRAVTPGGDVTTIAGLAGTIGNADGTGSAARFNFPTGIAIDSAGVIYVADAGNFTVRRVTASGEVTTLAGHAGSSGTADGNGGEARFALPWAVAVGADRSLYITDSNSHTIRRISSSGLVTTLAGSAGSSGTADGTGGTARFDVPVGAAIDAAGNLLVCDTNNRIIRRVTAAGVVTTIAGGPDSLGVRDGLASEARFYAPYGVAVDAGGVVYMTDRYANTVRVMTPR